MSTATVMLTLTGATGCNEVAEQAFAKDEARSLTIETIRQRPSLSDVAAGSGGFHF